MAKGTSKLSCMWPHKDIYVAHTGTGQNNHKLHKMYTAKNELVHNEKWKDKR